MLCQLTIDGQPFSFPLEGEFRWGRDEVLFDKHREILSGVDWQERGYSIFALLDEKEQEQLRDSIRGLLVRILAESNIVIPENFRLEDYHRYVGSQALHGEVISKTRFLTYADLGIDFGEMADRIARYIGHRLSLENPLLEKEIVILRISRPQSLDINPPHRDGSLDLWEDVLNVWIPVAGSNAQSSLPVIPGSHQWNEKDVLRTEAKGAAINGLRYHVPGIIQSRYGLHLIRPNPAYGDALLFTPFLVHGAAVNQNPNTTRMALELRFYGG
jgi:hypothetical protein